jgi:hypothetical protein
LRAAIGADCDGAIVANAEFATAHSTLPLPSPRFGCVKMDRDDDPNRDDPSEFAALHWLNDIPRDEARNVRNCVAVVSGKRPPAG